MSIESCNGDVTNLVDTGKVKIEPVVEIKTEAVFESEDSENDDANQNCGNDNYFSDNDSEEMDYREDSSESEFTFALLDQEEDTDYSGGENSHHDSEEEEEEAIKNEADNEEQEGPPLPLGWKVINHISSIPVYVFEKTHICTLSRPYRVNYNENIKYHEINQMSVPCMRFRKDIEPKQNDSKLLYLKRLKMNQNTSNASTDVISGYDKIEDANQSATYIDELENNTDVNQSGTNELLMLDERISYISETTNTPKTDVPSLGDEVLKNNVEIKDIVISYPDNISEEPLENNLTESKETDTKCDDDQCFRNTDQRKTIDISSVLVKKKRGTSRVSYEIQDSDLNSFQCKKNIEAFKYYNRLFPFKKIKYMKFKSWDVRRTYTRSLRNDKSRKHYRSLDKLVSLPIYKWDSKTKAVKKENWIANSKQSSHVAILHEYLQQSLKVQPRYKFKELENAKTPYLATVLINSIEYGSGVGKSKKDAKLKAAKATLDVLLPTISGDPLISPNKMKRDESQIAPVTDTAVFDHISILDPELSNYSLRAAGLTPYEVLQMCVQSKYSSQSVIIDYQVDLNKCTMSIGDNSVTISCRNKREGKQRASQALLQALHPHINNWGALLRLYNNQDPKNINKREHAEDEDLIDDTDPNPDPHFISALKDKMMKLNEKLGNKIIPEKDYSASNAFYKSCLESGNISLLDMMNKPHFMAGDTNNLSLLSDEERHVATQCMISIPLSPPPPSQLQLDSTNVDNGEHHQINLPMEVESGNDAELHENVSNFDYHNQSVSRSNKLAPDVTTIRKRSTSPTKGINNDKDFCQSTSANSHDRSASLTKSEKSTSCEKSDLQNKRSRTVERIKREQRSLSSDKERRQSNKKLSISPRRRYRSSSSENNQKNVNRRRYVSTKKRTSSSRSNRRRSSSLNDTRNSRRERSKSVKRDQSSASYSKYRNTHISSHHTLSFSSPARQTESNYDYKPSAVVQSYCNQTVPSGYLNPHQISNGAPYSFPNQPLVPNYNYYQSTPPPIIPYHSQSTLPSQYGYNPIAPQFNLEGSSVNIYEHPPPTSISSHYYYDNGGVPGNSSNY